MTPHEPASPPAPEARTADAELLDIPRLPAEHPAERERLARIRDEIAAGFALLADLGPAVAVFGSARIKPDDPTYALAVDCAHALGRAGYSIITGGGPGLMEAANRGAQAAGATSVGLNIELPEEQRANDFLDRHGEFRYFFARRLMFVRFSSAFVVLPGGFGTLDEMFEALTLIQTRKIAQFPVVLVDSGYWRGLLDWMQADLVGRGLIDATDLSQLHLVDTPDAAVDAIRRSAPRSTG